MIRIASFVAILGTVACAACGSTSQGVAVGPSPVVRLCEAGPALVWEELELMSLGAGVYDDEAQILAALGLPEAGEDDGGGYGTAVGGGYPLGDARWVPVAACARDDSGGGTRPCTIYIARLTTEGTVTASTAVMEADVGYQMMLGELVDVRLVPFDVDGDGVAEMVVELGVGGESLPAVGPQDEDWMAVLDASTGALLWRGRVGASGAGDHLDCVTRLTLQDLDCDGRRDIRLESDCWETACRESAESDYREPECPDDAPRLTDERWSQPVGERAYAPMR